MNNVVRIYPVVTQRYCPNCCHIVMQKEIELMRLNHLCPTCRVKRYSEFEPLPIIPTEGK